MNSKTSKIISIVSVILLVISAAAGIATFIVGTDPYIDMLLYWMYILVIVAFASILLLSFISMLSSKKSALSLLTVLAIASVIVFGCHAFASDSLPTFFGVEQYNLTIETSKWVDTALYVTYLLFGASIFGLIFTAIKSSVE